MADSDPFETHLQTGEESQNVSIAPPSSYYPTIDDESQFLLDSFKAARQVGLTLPTEMLQPIDHSKDSSMDTGAVMTYPSNKKGGYAALTALGEELPLLNDQGKPTIANDNKTIYLVRS